jgi:hypothetical protein
MRRRGEKLTRLRSDAVIRRLSLLAIGLVAAACAATSDQDIYRDQPVSVQAIEYYPFQVKGYQNTYARRKVVVIEPVDGRTFQDEGPSHAPWQDHPAIGVVLGRNDTLEQRIYGPPLGPLIQSAIVQSAREAGLDAVALNDPLATALKRNAGSYVLAATVTDAWVNKHRGPSNPEGATWFTAANVAVDAAIYKAPFDVPFWQGQSAAQFDDPPIASLGSMDPEDDTAIYDNPGQVLSVAFTRAVAGLFKRDDLRVLIGHDINH